MIAIGIDIGTTTISAVVYDVEKNTEFRAVTIQNGSDVKSDRSFEKIQDPEIIVSKVMGLLEEIEAEFAGQEIVAIGLTGQMHGMLYLNAEGRAVSYLYTWQDESGDQEEFDGRSVCGILREEGIRANSGYGLVTYLYHLRRNMIPEGAVQLCTIADYVGMRLTGRRRPLVHISNAASLGFFDVEKNRFQTDLLGKYGAELTFLPEVTIGFEIQGCYRGIPVSVALGDNQASFLGAVEHPEREILVNMGTGGQISVLSDRIFPSRIIEVRPFDGENYLLVGASLCGGRAYAVLADFYRRVAEALGIEEFDPYQLMEHLLSVSEASKEISRACSEPNKEHDTASNIERFIESETERLSVSTLFAGTREDSTLRGSIQNIGVNNFTPEALTEGVLHGMARELYEMFMEICSGGGAQNIRMQWRGMIASGNGFRKNPYLCKEFEKQFGMPLALSDTAEEAAVGAVKCALRAAGIDTATL